MTRADQRKYHYIYKITRVDGWYYIGLHSTDNLDDGYFGSGQRLWHSIKKHGKEKHSKEIVEFLPSRRELKDRERELVNEETLKDPQCMNMVVGGNGGFVMTAEQQSKMSKKYWEDPVYRKKITERWNDPVYRAKMMKQWDKPEVRQTRSKQSAVLWQTPEYREKLSNFGSYERTPETLAKLSAAMSKAKSGKPWSAAKRAAYEANKAMKASKP